MRCKRERKEDCMSTIITVNPATDEEIQTYTIMTEQEASDRVEGAMREFG